MLFRSIEDGQTFSVDDGTKAVIFEFTSTGALTTGDRAIPFTYSQTNEIIAQTIADQIRAANLGLDPLYKASSDGLVNVGGQLRHVIDVTDSTLLSTGLPGATPALGIRIPTSGGRLDLQRIADGENITVTNGTNSLTIELDSDGVTQPGDPNSHPHVVVAFNTATTVAQLANAIAIAIRNGGVGLSPTNLGFGVIQLGGTAQHSVDLTNRDRKSVV